MRTQQPAWRKNRRNGEGENRGKAKKIFSDSPVPRFVYKRLTTEC
jgi:hypothetical protein